MQHLRVSPYIHTARSSKLLAYCVIQSVCTTASASRRASLLPLLKREKVNRETRNVDDETAVAPNEIYEPFTNSGLCSRAESRIVIHEGASVFLSVRVPWSFRKLRAIHNNCLTSFNASGLPEDQRELSSFPSNELCEDKGTPLPELGTCSHSPQCLREKKSSR